VIITVRFKLKPYRMLLRVEIVRVLLGPTRWSCTDGQDVWRER
jgi:hypothetical protein